MERANPFAQVPSTPEPIIAQVRRQLADEAPLVMTIEASVLDRVAERAVRELWEAGSRPSCRCLPCATPAGPPGAGSADLDGTPGSAPR